MPDIADKSHEQKNAEAEVDRFRSELGPFVTAAESTRMPMAFTDARTEGNLIIFANSSLQKLTGFSEAELLGQKFGFLLAEPADATTVAELDDQFGASAKEDSGTRYRRKDGSDFCASTFVSPVVDVAGQINQYFVSLIDLTSHHDERAHATMLIDELNHRVKNTLATVHAIVSQALRNSGGPDELREAIESRLFALSSSHDLLTQQSWEGVGLRDLVETALKPFAGVDGTDQRFVVSGENIPMTPNATLALGIAFHELATNAVKYGAFSNSSGFVRISWSTIASESGDRIVILWRENGGPPVAPPTRKGFGSQVIERGLAHELQGKISLDYQPTGVVCSIDIPAAKVRSVG